MAREHRIKLSILKMLREDRSREYGTKGVFNRVRENIHNVMLDEVEDVLLESVSSGIIYRRFVGNAIGNVYKTYSLNKRPNNVSG